MKKTTLLMSAMLFALPATASWQLQTGSNRQSTLQQQLNQFNSNISSTDRQSKYAKMNASVFSFYRGTAHWYYRDLDQQQIIAASGFDSSSAVTWLQGDLHVENYGSFDDDTGSVVYDLNDFDESWVDSYLYDVYRAATSLILVAKQQGFNASSDQQTIVDAFTESYLDQLENYRGNNNEKGAKVVESSAYGRLDEFLADVASSNSRKAMLDKWTNDLGSQRYFDLSYAKLASVTSQERSAITAAISQYHYNISSHLSGDSDYFKVLDVARRVDAGTGSLGTTRYYVLIDGASTGDNDDRILDVKQQGLPSIYPYLSAASQSNLLSAFSSSAQGCRVVAAQKAMLTDVDDHLGCTTILGDSYSVRERSPFKDSFDTTVLTSMTRFTKLAEQWGSILATAHARADKDYDANLVADQFEDVMHQLANGHHAEVRAEVFGFAAAYAAQAQQDFALFQSLYQSGSLN